MGRAMPNRCIFPEVFTFVEYATRNSHVYAVYSTLHMHVHT